MTTLDLTHLQLELQAKAHELIERMIACDRIAVMVRSLPPEHPPWEPTEEQITAYCRERERHDGIPGRELSRRDLIAAHAVFEGDPT